MEEDIHFKHLPYSAWKELEIKLEPNHGNNWRKLAEKIASYTTEQVIFLESRKGDTKSCTMLLLEDYVKQENASINQVREALEEMERKDALEVLNRYKTEVQLNQQRARQQHLSGGRGGGGLGGGVFGGVGQCLRSGEENSIDWSDTLSNPMFSYHSGLYNMAGGHMRTCHPLHSPPVSHPHHPPHFNLPHHSPPVTHHSMNGLYLSHRGHPHNGMYPYHYCPNIQGPISDSMLVQGDPGPTPMDLSMDDIPGERRLEDPAQLPQTILRGETNQHSLSLHPNSMGHLGSIDVGREEVVDGSGPEEMEYISMTPGHGRVGRPVYTQQHSEERNNKQPGGEIRVIIKKRVDNPDQRHLVNNLDRNHHLMDPRSAASPPISKLQRLAEIPPKYQPDREFKNIVADQKVEDTCTENRNVIKHERGTVQAHAHVYDTNLYMNHGKGNPKPKNGMRDIPKTFPRSKTQSSQGTAMSELRRNQPNSLTKSTSMPVDMKPAEFRKAFKHIRVFVTYSNDNKKHLQRVLSLCNCLVKNGFSCCVDINNRYIATLPNQQDRVSWYRQKFEESDFILVCPSPKYKMEVTAQETSSQNAPVPENQLHTRYIYRLMQQEYEHHGSSSRFVPVLFEGHDESLLPHWLQVALTYRWPTQFKDLLWMLTRPEERIKPRPRPFSENSSQSNSPHHQPKY